MKEKWVLIQNYIKGNSYEGNVEFTFHTFNEAVKALHDKRLDFSPFGTPDTIANEDTLESILFQEVETDDGTIEVSRWCDPLYRSAEEWKEHLELMELRKTVRR